MVLGLGKLGGYRNLLSILFGTLGLPTSERVEGWGGGGGGGGAGKEVH